MAPLQALTQALPPSTASGAAHTPVVTMRDAVQQAVLSNPEVLSRWHAIRSAEGERDAARGGLLPRLDVTTAIGPERRTGLGDYQRRSSGVTLSQLLYDGFSTYGEFQRLGHTTRVRMFEFFDVSEGVALEASRAWFDVIRYRDLVRLAEDNYVEHRAVYAQTERRVTAKIARAVDLEQVTGRLALAQANLLTEVANLHDTAARYQRIIGAQPPAVMALPPVLRRDLPPEAATAIMRSQERHPALLAAIESVRASRAALDTRKGAFGPRVDFRVRRDTGVNYTGALGPSSTSTAEVVLNWNLFSGFADQARDRQFAGQLNVALELRDKTCRDLRQTLLIAFNDIAKLTEQLESLVQHETAVGKALVAYRLQFDIGQRTLLDLLDTENELFQARRAVVNARMDLNFAYARTQAGLGTLLRSLELTALKDGGEAELADWAMDADAARACPAEPINVRIIDKEVLMQRAVQQAARLQTLNARERAIQEAAVVAVPQAAASPPGATTAPAGTQGSVAATPSGGPVPSSAAPEPARNAAAADVRQSIEAWRHAWTARDIDGYLASYARDFRPAGGGSRSDWEKARRAVLGSAADVQVEVVDPQVTFINDVRATVAFVQHYRSSSYRDTVRKTLELRREDGRWRIVSEQSAPAAPPAGR